MKKIGSKGALVGLTSLALASQAWAININEKLSINGYSSFEFEYQVSEDGKGGKGDPNASFDADMIDIVFNVRPVQDLRIAVDLTWEHGTATEDNLGNAGVEYAYPEWTAASWLKIRAGKMFTHFGIYNEIHTAKPTFLEVKEPTTTNKNYKFGSDVAWYPRWTTGLGFLGDFEIGETPFSYILQVGNGTQEATGSPDTNPHDADNNLSKSVNGRIKAEVSDDLSVGASFYGDPEVGVADLDDEGDPFIDSKYSIITTGGQFEYIKDEVFTVQGEYLYGQVDNFGGDLVKRQAMTLLLAANGFGDLTPFVRWGMLDPNLDIENDIAQRVIYGLNYQVVQGLFFKLEMNHVLGDSDNEHIAKYGSYNEIKSSISVGF